METTTAAPISTSPGGGLPAGSEFSAPSAAPIVVPSPVAPPPSAAPTQNNMGGAPQSGGGSINNAGDFLKSINWFEVVFMTLGATAMYYTIYYYRFKLKEDRIAQYDSQRQINKISQRIGKVETMLMSGPPAASQQPASTMCTLFG